MKPAEITLNKEGARAYTRASHPIRYGRYHQLSDGHVTFQFNLNHEITHIRGRGEGWPPGEWLKRTAGNHWVYYSSGDYQGLIDLYGEYYVPCLPYPSNSIIRERPFARREVKSILAEWPDLVRRLTPATAKGKQFLTRVAANHPGVLAQKARQLIRIIGGRVTVLPPDSRQADYQVIPLTVADGCSYRCSFCRVKTGKRFWPRSLHNVRTQIDSLKNHLGPDLPNHNTVFLGQHDALAAGRDILIYAAEQAHRVLELERSFVRGAFLHLFGSVDSLLGADDALFEALDALPYQTWINIGLESADQRTLDQLGKPLAAPAVREAFGRMLDLNRRHPDLEITANFLWGPDLSRRHTESLIELTHDWLDKFYAKGILYLSPWLNDRRSRPGRREVLRRIHAIQNRCRLPVLLYLIQRL